MREIKSPPTSKQALETYWDSIKDTGKNILRFDGLYKQIMTDSEPEDFMVALLMRSIEFIFLFLKDGNVIKDNPDTEDLNDLKKYYETALISPKLPRCPYTIDSKSNVSIIHEYSQDGELCRNVFVRKIKAALYLWLKD